MNQTQLATDLEAIVADFVGACRSAGCNPPFLPGVKIQNTPGLISIYKGVITAPFWVADDEEFTQIFDNWASNAGGAFTGEQLFRDIFNWFLVAHELGHFVQKTNNAELSHWEAEINANMIAVAFWQMQGCEKRLETMINQTQSVWATLPRPVPEAEAPESFFNNNYSVLSQNPDAYGYFQFMFFKQAYDASPNFGDLVTPTNLPTS